VILILQRLALAGYAIATLLAFSSILLRRRVIIALAPAFAAGAFLCQLGAFVYTASSRTELPFWSVDQILAFLTLVAVLIYLYGYWRYQLQALGVVMLPLALVLHLVSGWMPAHALPISDELRDPLMWFHIVVSTLGVAAFFLTFTFSVIYLIQERALKEKQSARFFLRLPSLTTCDRILYVSLVIGFLFLTAGLALAAVWSANFRGSFHIWENQREILALIAWMIFGLVLYARAVRGWRGRKMAVLAICGFVVVMLRIIGGPFL
jgi:ABC-type uncharacterized transport system permease subunit